jgi:hypothetical protein
MSQSLAVVSGSGQRPLSRVRLDRRHDERRWMEMKEMPEIADPRDPQGEPDDEPAE